MADNRAAIVATVTLLVKKGVRTRDDVADAGAVRPMTIATLARIEPSREWALDIGTCAVSLLPGHSVPKWLAALEWALADEPPPFSTATYAAMYRRASSNPQWMAVSLIKQAERAGRAASHLWGLAAGSTDRQEIDALKRHAVRRSEHVLAHLDVVDLTFPGAIGPDLRASLVELSPGYAMEHPLSSQEEGSRDHACSTGDLLEANYAAIRTAALQMMEGTAVREHCVPENVTPATEAVDALILDDLQLVADTARLVERRVSDMDTREVAHLASRCLRRMIRSTSEEPIDFTYNMRFGNYP